MSEQKPGPADTEPKTSTSGGSARKAFQKGRTSPSHTLEDAVQGVDRVYRALGTTPHSREDAAQAMGYKAGSGAANSRVGSLTHFNLLARRGASYEVTELARRIIEHTDETDRQLAMAEAAGAPSLYSELIERFDGQPLPPMLPNILSRDFGVVPKNTAEVASRFEETLRFAGLLRDGKVWATVAELTNPTRAQHSAVTREHSGQPLGGEEVHCRGATKEGSIAGGGYRVPLTKKREAVLFLPRPVESSDLDRIKAWIDLMADVLTECDEVVAEEKPETE